MTGYPHHPLNPKNRLHLKHPKISSPNRIGYLSLSLTKSRTLKCDGVQKQPHCPAALQYAFSTCFLSFHKIASNIYYWHFTRVEWLKSQKRKIYLLPIKGHVMGLRGTAHLAAFKNVYLAIRWIRQRRATSRSLQSVWSFHRLFYPSVRPSVSIYVRK